MDHVHHPLDWWAYDGDAVVILNTGWTLPQSRCEVRKTIHAYGWHPIGHRAYEELRRCIMDGQVLDHDLI